MKKTPIIIVVVLVVIAAVLGSQYAMHAKGNACFQNGDYENAAVYYDKDSLFSKGLAEEAMKMAGKDAMEKGQFQKAITILEEHGPDMTDELCQAYCGLARDTIATDPAKAMDILNAQTPSANTQALVNSVRVEIAQYYLTNSAYDDALAAAETVADASFPGVQEVKNEVYYTQAMEALDAMFAAEERSTATTTASLRDIQQLLDLCVNDSRTTSFSNLINPLLDGRFEEAVGAVFTVAKEYPTYSTDKWLEIFREMMPNESYANWKDQMENQQRIFAMFCQQDTSLTGSHMQQTITDLVDEKGTAFYEAHDFDMDIPKYGDVKTVLKSIGNNPNGKILILREYYGDRDGAPAGSSMYQKRLAVYGDLMNAMPAEFYPNDLDEVEYVIVISYDFKVTGTYMSMGRIISGRQESGTVTVYSMPGLKSIYNSGTQQGIKLGNRVTMTNDRVLSGGRPKLGSYVIKALETIEKKMG